MYPSSNIENPFESLFKRSFPFDQKPSPKQDDPSLFFHFPSPFLDENEFPLNQILFQNHPMTVHNCIAHDYQIETYLDGTKRETTEGCNIDPSKLNEKSTESIPNEAITLAKKNLGSLLLKRTGKKDRHSKICTARGVRDRRMRLSLQVARKFFDLQDLLGYDKASKTIEWLFTKSTTAIKELSKNNPKVKTNSILDDLNSESFVSECDMVSVIEENSINAHKGAAIKYASTERKKNDKKSQKSVYKPNSRESRDKARARARDRTRKKMIIKGLENSNKWWFDSNPNDFQQLEPFSSSLEAVEESSSHNQKHDAYTNSLESQLFDVGIIEKFLGNSSTDSWAIHDYSNNNFLEFLGNWDVNNDRINSEMTNMVSFAGNPSSVYFPTSCFPFQQ